MSDCNGRCKYNIKHKGQLLCENHLNRLVKSMDKQKELRPKTLENALSPLVSEKKALLQRIDTVDKIIEHTKYLYRDE